MTHDEAIRVLNSTRWMLLGKERDALDYAIAYMEPKPTQFDERIATLESIIAEAIYRDDYPHHEDYIPIIKDMQSHIRKLESELEKWKEDARIAAILKSEPKWNRDI
jgi:hypothetical protein